MAPGSGICDSSSAKPPSQGDRQRVWGRLASEYLSDLPRQLGRIRANLAIKDYSAIKRQAHRIKGTSGTYRFDALARTAAKLERLAETKNPDAIAGAINKTLQLVELEIRKFRSQAVVSADTAERKQDG
ncbi:MAG: Hpt domain-containing protein [Planctomycetota bacterium]|jgi:HPt (histidine-containing phosphotransfer) domain-containing protein